MKKILAMMLAAMLVLSLAACDDAQSGNQTTGGKPDDSTTAAPVQTTAPTQETTAPQENEVYSFTFEGVELIPGAPFDPNALPEAASVYEVPSCAIEGTDNVYNYETLEVTAFNDGTGETIYSIYIIDANTATPEGLYLGDDAARVTELYGSDRSENGNEIVYQQGDTMLVLIMENDTVISIEYRLAA